MCDFHAAKLTTLQMETYFLLMISIKSKEMGTLVCK